MAATRLQASLVVVFLFLVTSPAAALRTQQGAEQHAEPADWQGQRVAGPASSRTLRPGLLHFMFLLKDQLQHPGIWGKFWSQALPGSYMAWAHCTNHHACENDYMMSLLKVRLVPTVFSMHGGDLVTPFAHMIRLALAETRQLAADGVVEKFLVVGDTTLPIKPFPVVHWDQTARPESDICISSPQQWGVSTYEGVPVTIVKHHQWVSLNRHDAKALADDWEPVRTPRGWNVTLRTGKWAAKPVRVPRAHLKVGVPWTATDEEAMYERAFGPMILKSVNDTKSMFDLFNTRRCITYVDWPANVYPQNLLDGHEQASLLQTDAAVKAAVAAGLFYNVTNEVTKELLKDDNFKYSIARGVKHPIQFEKLGSAGLRALRASRYLLARKFSSCAHLPNFTEIVLGE